MVIFILLIVTTTTKIEHNKELNNLLNIKRTGIHMLFYVAGIVLGIMYKPEIIVFFIFITVLTWFIHVYLSIKDIDVENDNTC